MITSHTLRSVRTPATSHPEELDPDKRCHCSITLPVKVETGGRERTIGERHYDCQRTTGHSGVHDALVEHTDDFPVRW